VDDDAWTAQDGGRHLDVHRIKSVRSTVQSPTGSTALSSILGISFIFEKTEQLDDKVAYYTVEPVLQLYGWPDDHTKQPIYHRIFHDESSYYRAVKAAKKCAAMTPNRYKGKSSYPVPKGFRPIFNLLSYSSLSKPNLVNRLATLFSHFNLDPRTLTKQDLAKLNYTVSKHIGHLSRAILSKAGFWIPHMIGTSVEDLKEFTHTKMIEWLEYGRSISIHDLWRTVILCELGEQLFSENVPTAYDPETDEGITFTEFLTDRLFSSEICMLCHYGVLLDQGQYVSSNSEDEVLCVTCDRGLPPAHFESPALFSSHKNLTVWLKEHDRMDIVDEDILVMVHDRLDTRQIPHNIPVPLVGFSAFRNWEHAHVTIYDTSVKSTLETPNFRCQRLEVDSLLMRLLVTLITWISRVGQSDEWNGSTAILLPRPLEMFTSMFQNLWTRGERDQALLAFVALNTLRRVLYTMSVPDDWRFLFETQDGSRPNQVSIYRQWISNIGRLMSDPLFIGLTSSRPRFEIHPDCEHLIEGLIDRLDFVPVYRDRLGPMSDVVSLQFKKRISDMFK
jgi:hypothetical protein